MSAPFPYFGGKKSVARDVWDALGNVKHYIEPFFGSGAVLLARPHNLEGKLETICDKDGFVANVWRSLQHDPDEVARWCDWPVNHADLNARRKRLLENEQRLLENLAEDDRWFDPLLAGYWIWAASCWIGSGLTRPGAKPHLSNTGMGVHKLSKRPHVAHAGKGVHKLGQRPHLGCAGKGVQDPYNTNIYNWFRELSERLRYVRVVCGDWTRVCGGNWQDNMGTCGIFFDPPYAAEDRDQGIYHQDSRSVANEVRAWALARGDRESYRIVIAEYDEHDVLEQYGWICKRWVTNGGYGKLGQGMENRNRETLWFSPHCINSQPNLFD